MFNSKSPATVGLFLYIKKSKKTCRSKNLDYICILIKQQKVMPTLFTVFGLRFFFHSNEHLPIHIHVKNSDGECVFQVDPEIKLIKNRGMKTKDLKITESLVIENREPRVNYM